MRKTLTYSAFLSAALVVIAMFVTSKSYVQLAASVVLYPFVALFGYKIYLDISKNNRRHQQTPANAVVVEPEVPEEDLEEIVPQVHAPDAVDIDKRAFLKIIGATGISYLLFSFLGKRFDTPFLGSGANPLQGQMGQAPSHNALENYQITEIGYDNLLTYYGFVADDGSWIIMKEDSANNSFRYAKGKSDFGGNWNAREALNFHYYHDLQK